VLPIGNGDLTQIRFCRTHLHQVQGALTIVGLDGVTQFAEALESLLEAIEKQERPPCSRLHRSCATSAGQRCVITSMT
jgi:chemotaxis protein histidine kinase CheA